MKKKKSGLALARLSMTFSWHNINFTYGNNQVKYSNDNGSTWQTILFVDGMHSYDDINDYIQGPVLQNGDDKEGISLTFVLSSYREFKNSKCGDRIGFDAKIIKKY